MGTWKVTVSSFCRSCCWIRTLKTFQQVNLSQYLRIIITSGCPWSKATVKPPVWNPGPKIEIPHPENHILKVFRFWSWKPRVWKSRPQSWDPKSWKPCLENHILKFPRPQSWDPKSWKPYPKISQVFLPGLAWPAPAALPWPPRPAPPCPVCNCCPALPCPLVKQTDRQTCSITTYLPTKC